MNVREKQSTWLAAGGTTVEKSCMLKDSRIYSVGRLGAETCKRHGGRAHDGNVGGRSQKALN